VGTALDEEQQVKPIPIRESLAGVPGLDAPQGQIGQQVARHCSNSSTAEGPPKRLL
jgi:hypothetical protein